MKKPIIKTTPPYHRFKCYNLWIKQINTYNRENELLESTDKK